MIENEQQERALHPAEVAPATFAEVTGIHYDGLSIRLEGGTGQEGDKHYKCNRSCVFQVGDRVRVTKDSGSYVVEYPVGSPSTESTATIAETALVVDNYAPGIADLRFYYDTQGTFWVQSIKDTVGQWTKLTGTVGRPPKL